MSIPDGDGLSIGTVADRTGVAIAVLRSWQERFGFPTPARTGSGHRRYRSADVEQILQVVAGRADGLSLEAAIRKVVSAETAAPTTIVGALRQRHPDLPVNVWPAATMLAVSRAIEDECLVNGRGGVLIGSFQRTDAFEAARSRWQDAAGADGRIIAFADAPAVVRRGATTLLPAGRSLAAEWAVVCATAGAAAFLGGRQLPGQRATGARRKFEVTLSVEPIVVSTAADIGLQIVAASAADVADSARGALADLTEAPAATVRRAVSILNRSISRTAAPRPTTRRRAR